MSIVKGRDGLVQLGLPAAAKKRCFHCEKPLHKTKPIFFWFGAETLVMHMPCFADWIRRAQRDLDKHYGIVR